ncbi:MAG: polysaccharide biosynthesis protein [Hyphomicrobiales bacterium]|nr:polysaccharide biosynthesis protein [Hyphomicrobiales bacterium]
MSQSLVDSFVKDPPYPPPSPVNPNENVITDPIDGCIAIPLRGFGDERGVLTELLTTRDGDIEPIVHVYQVSAAPGSIRGWVYHALQSDRLAFTSGKFQVVLYDLRENSPTFGTFNELTVGEEYSVFLRVPPFVAHWVRNVGDAFASFTNLPTRVFQRDDPDKYRLAWDTDIIKYDFDR